MAAANMNNEPKKYGGRDWLKLLAFDGAAVLEGLATSSIILQYLNYIE